MKDKKIGIVVSEFNIELTKKMELGASEVLKEAGFVDSNIVRVFVPGAFEIPLAAKYLLKSGCEGVIGLGLVIRGGTSHFDYVCQAVTQGSMQVQLEAEKPVIFGVLTTETRKQAERRIGGGKGHKGREAAIALVKMLKLKSEI